MNIMIGIFCVILFSLTVPFTRLAALEIAPEIVAVVRLFLAGCICFLLIAHDRWTPPKPIWRPLFFTSFGAVLGFGSLMAFALHTVPSSHGALALAALPAATAAYASLRDRHNPGRRFWLFAISGTALSFSFFWFNSQGQWSQGDILLGLAVISAAFGYVEGARLSRDYGGIRVMSWAVFLTLPVTLCLILGMSLGDLNNLYRQQLQNLSATGWFSMVYLALISQSGGMFLWYHALAKGPLEKVAMTQLLQPFFTLLAAILLLREHIHPTAWLITLLVGLCVVGANGAKNPSQKMA